MYIRMLRQSVSGHYISYVLRISFSYQTICVSCNSSYLIADNFATPCKKRKSLLIRKFACGIFVQQFRRVCFS